MLWILLTIVVVGAAYLFSLRGRRGHSGMQELAEWNYAHRGLHNARRPENSMAAFRAALEGGFGIELDVHLLADGSLAVLHDSDLQRVTGREGVIENLRAEQLSAYSLCGSDQTIPLFRDVLTLFAGKAPLIVELKTYKDNYAALTETVCDLMADYPGPYCLESFDPRCIRWLRVHRPELIRGQLAENAMANKQYPWLLRLVTTYYLENFLTRPDFIAYRYADRKTLSNFLCRTLWGIHGVSWTIRTPEEMHCARQEGWIPIFENFIP